MLVSYKITYSKAMVRDVITKLDADGYAVVRLPDPAIVHETRAALQAEIRRIVDNPKVTLETYHQYAEEDNFHFKNQVRLVEFARKHRLSRRILDRQLNLFSQFFGPDIAMTVPDAFRMVRPGKRSDNLGYHRDSDYGNTAYEINVFIPFVALDELSALKVLPKSHTKNYEDFPWHQETHPFVERGDDLNRVGFLYAPKVFDIPIEQDLVAPPLAIGEALLFSANVIHGQLINQGSVTRWSTDFEVVNSLAPIQWIHHSGVHHFEIVTESYFSRIGRNFHKPELPRIEQRAVALPDAFVDWANMPPSKS